MHLLIPFISSKIRIAYQRLEQHRQNGYTPEEAANMCGIEMTQAAEVSKIPYWLWAYSYQ